VGGVAGNLRGTETQSVCISTTFGLYDGRN
jgi:hypothetical protein